MGRKKADSEEVLEVELNAEVEAVEPDEIEAQDVAALEEDETEKTPKPARRRNRKKAEQTVAAVEPQIEAAGPAPAVPVVEAPVAPNAAAVVATTTDEKDLVVRQWEAAKQTSESIVASLDKVNSLLKELPDHYAAVLQKSMKQSSARTTPGAKIAFGMSMVASVLSVLSLSFSQSARELVLSHEVSVPAVHRAAEDRTLRPTKNTSLDMLATLEGLKNKRAKKVK